MAMDVGLLRRSVEDFPACRGREASTDISRDPIRYVLSASTGRPVLLALVPRHNPAFPIAS